MTETEKQSALIRSLVGKCSIRVEEDGFLSRGFVVDDGRLVFKFPRDPSVRYGTEIRNLDFINSLDLGVALQRTAYVSPTDAFLGVWGVPGTVLEQLQPDGAQKAAVGRQLGHALKKLHAARPPEADVLTLREELDAWAERVSSEEVRAFLETEFPLREREALYGFFFREAPERLPALGERLVFSHGDLSEGNVVLDKEGRVGIIDFNESCYLEEAADFMDIRDDAICEAMLTAYGADEPLREKVALRRKLRPLVVLQPCLRRGRREEIAALTEQLRAVLPEIEPGG